jgi:hypothetical protein
MVNKKTISRLNDQQILTVGNDIMAFFEAMHWENDNSDPFADFGAKIEVSDSELPF